MTSPVPIHDMNLTNLTVVSVLEQALWDAPGKRRRSTEITPLFVRRYTGARLQPIFGRHPFWEMTFVFAGVGTILFPARHRPGAYPDRISLRPKSVILLPPGLTHGEESAGMLDTLWIGLKGDRIRGFAPAEVHAVHNADELAPLCEQLWLQSQRRNLSIGPELDGLTATLLARLERLASESEDVSASYDFIESVVHYLYQHYAEPITVAQLAERWGYSEGYFYRAFKRRMGRTPVEYLTELRLAQAAQMMCQSTWSIARISKSVGYRDPLYFSRVFRTHTGEGPTAFRARFRKNVKGEGDSGSSAEDS